MQFSRESSKGTNLLGILAEVETTWENDRKEIIKTPLRGDYKKEGRIERKRLVKFRVWEIGEKGRRGTHQGRESNTKGKFWYFIVGLPRQHLRFTIVRL